MKKLMPPPIFQFFDANGLPLAGGKLWSYVAGTTTPLATFTDSTGVTPNANPLILDANGKCVVWIGPEAYKFILTDANDVVQWTRDNIQDIPDGSIVTIKLADGSVTTVKIADDAVTTPKILDANVTTAKIADNAITAPKIPNAGIPMAKLAASTQLVLVDSGGPRDGDGPTAFPKPPWSTPTLIAVPSSPAVGDGLGVRWSKNGKILAVAENNTDCFALFNRFGTELVRLSPGFFPGRSAACNGLDWSPEGDYLYTANLDIFQKCGNTYAPLLFPGAIAGTRNAVAASPSGNHVAYAHDGSPYVTILKRNDIAPNQATVVYTSNSGQTIPDSTATIVNFEDTEIDNLGAVTIGASWFWSCKRANTYFISARAEWDNSATGTNVNVARLEIWKNFSLWKVLDTKLNASVKQLCLQGGISVAMDVGEFIQIKIFSAAASVASLITDGTKNWVSITEGGGFNQLSKFTVLSNPATLPTGHGKCAAWSRDGQFLAVGNGPIYSFIVTAANATAGATYADSNGHSYVVAQTISGATLLVASGTVAPAPSGVLTKTAGTGDPTITYSSVSPSPSFLTIYQRTGDVFVKCADPASLPPGQVNGLAWSPDGLKLTCAHAISPFITTYSRSGTTFTKLADPAALPAGTGNAAAYNSTGDKLAVAHDSSPFLTIYSVSGSTFTKDADPGLLPPGNGKSVDWTPDGRFLTIGHVSSPYMSTYQTSGVNGQNAVLYVGEVDLV